MATITKKADGSEIATFEYQGQTSSAYWNGKKYAGNTFYVTADNNIKITISDRNGIQVRSTVPMAFAKAALRALEII